MLFYHVKLFTSFYPTFCSCFLLSTTFRCDPDPGGGRHKSRSTKTIDYLLHGRSERPAIHSGLIDVQSQERGRTDHRKSISTWTQPLRLLTSCRRCRTRCARTTRHKNSFLPQAVPLMNSQFSAQTSFVMFVRLLKIRLCIKTFYLLSFMVV